jgi:hypothetical protein
MSRFIRSVVTVALVGLGVGCGRGVDIEQVPIGAAVEITREDGGVVRGTLTARDGRQLRMAVGTTTRSIAREEVANVEVVEGTTPTALPPSARFREFTVPGGTVLALRLASSIGSDTSRVNDTVEAVLSEAVMIDGVTVLPADSVVKGVVSSAEPSGKVSGRANLEVRFRSVSIDGLDETVAVSANLHRMAASTRGADARTIGIPAAGGAVLGAILGGKKGAGVGAAVGGGAGTAVVLATAGEDVRFPTGAAVWVVLDEAIEVRVPIVR